MLSVSKALKRICRLCVWRKIVNALLSRFTFTRSRTTRVGDYQDKNNFASQQCVLVMDNALLRREPLAERIKMCNRTMTARCRRRSLFYPPKPAFEQYLGGNCGGNHPDASERPFTSPGAAFDAAFFCLLFRRRRYPAEIFLFAQTSQDAPHCGGKRSRQRPAKAGMRLFQRALQKPNILSAQQAESCALHRNETPPPGHIPRTLHAVS